MIGRIGMNRRSHRLSPLTFAVACLAASLADARTIYVNNLTGDDRNTGEFARSLAGSGGGPTRTVAKALRLARRGDRIELAATEEPYREEVTLQGFGNSGFPEQPLVIDGGGAILDGSAPVPEFAWEHFNGDIFRFRPPRMAFQMLFRDDVPLTRVPVEPGALALPELPPLAWCLFDRHIYLRVEETRTPGSYNLSHTFYRVGITLYQVERVQIANLIIQGFQLDGINAHDSATHIELAGVTTRGCGRSGVSVGGSSRVTLESCLSGNNGAAQLRTEAWCEARLEGCDLIANTAPAVVREEVMQGAGRVYINDVQLPLMELTADVTPTALMEEAEAPAPAGGVMRDE